MYVGSDFDVATVGETDWFAFDFANDIGDDELIDAATWDILVHAGSDPQAASRLVGTAQVEHFVAAGQRRAVTRQKVSGLLAGVTYTLIATVTTNQGRVLRLWSRVSCVAPD